MQLLSSIADLKDIVNKEYIDSILADYVLSANLGALATKDSLAFSDLTSRPSKLSDFTDDVVAGKYLELSGGRMQGSINWAIEQTSAWDNFFNTGSNLGLRILNTAGYSVEGAPSDYAVGLIVSGYYGYALAWDANNEQLKYRGSGKSDWRTLIHSGNYATEIGDYYLKSSGGTIESAEYTPLILKRQSPYGVGISFENNSGKIGAITVDNQKKLFFVSDSFHEILHSGNVGDYALPLTGGTISGDLTIKKENGESTLFLGANGRVVYNPTDDTTSLYNGGSGYPALKVQAGLGHPVFRYNYEDYALVHSGNYSDYALPLSGGTINGSLILNSPNSDYALHFQTGVGAGWIGFQANTERWFVTNRNWAADYTIIHSGNIGAYALKYYGTDMPSDVVNIVGYGKKDGGWKEYGPAISFGIANYYTQIQRKYNSNDIYVRGYWEGKYSDWKTVAFTDSDITGTANNAKQLGGYDASVYPTFENAATYIGFNLHTNYQALGQGDGYIEFYDGGWYNSVWGKVTAVNGFVGNLSGNASSATKLATARTIWGQSFDGTGNITGNLTLGNRVSLCVTDNSGTAIDAMYITAANHLVFGTGAHSIGGYTFIGGDNLFLRYGSPSPTIGVVLNQHGNVTIGNSDLAGTSAKLHVDGNISTSGEVFLNHNKAIRMKGSNGTDYNVLFTSGTDLNIGYDSPVIRFGGSKMFINPSGNVTIGSSDLAGTSAKLHVDGLLYSYAVASNVSLSLNRNPNSGAIYSTDKLALAIENSATAITFNAYRGNGSKIGVPLTINDSGNVTIGSTDLAGTSAKLYVDGGIRFASRKIWGQSFDGTGDVDGYMFMSGLDVLHLDESNLWLNYGAADDGKSLRLCGNDVAIYYGKSSNFARAMTINSSGNVGIANANPAYKLDVAGSIRTTTSLTIGTIVLTDENGTLKIAGNAYTTGQLGAGEAGQPTSGGGSVQYWSNEYDMDIGTDILVSSKEYIGTNTIVGWDLAGSCLNDLYIGYDGYTIWMQGSVDEASDMRLKTVIDAVNLDIRDIAYAPIFNYVFKSRPQGRQMLGSSAQYWQTIAPKAVSENDKGNLAMNYGAIALASVVAVAKKTLTHEEEIAELKSKVQSLETRLAKYELN